MSSCSLRDKLKKGRGRGKGKGEKLRPPFFSSSQSPTLFDACYAGYQVAAARRSTDNSVSSLCNPTPIPFRKRSLPFLTVDTTIGNQAFSHDGCYIFPGLSYNKANDAFLKSLRKNSVEAQVEFASKVGGSGSTLGCEQQKGKFAVTKCCSDRSPTVFLTSCLGLIISCDRCALGLY